METKPLEGNFCLQLAGRSIEYAPPILSVRDMLIAAFESESLYDSLLDRNAEDKRRLVEDWDLRFDLARSHLVKSNTAAIFSQMVSEARTEEIHARAETVEEENKRLRADNERLTRVIDSGDWGRARADELVRAGEVLSGERDALTKLIGRLQREHASVQDGKRRQEEEMRSMKDKMLSGVSGSSSSHFV